MAAVVRGRFEQYPSALRRAQDVLRSGNWVRTVEHRRAGPGIDKLPGGNGMPAGELKNVLTGQVASSTANNALACPAEFARRLALIPPRGAA